MKCCYICHARVEKKICKAIKMSLKKLGHNALKKWPSSLELPGHVLVRNPYYTIPLCTLLYQFMCTCSFVRGV